MSETYVRWTGWLITNTQRNKLKLHQCALNSSIVLTHRTDRPLMFTNFLCFAFNPFPCKTSLIKDFLHLSSMHSASYVKGKECLTTNCFIIIMLVTLCLLGSSHKNLCNICTKFTWISQKWSVDLEWLATESHWQIYHEFHQVIEYAPKPTVTFWIPND